MNARPLLSAKKIELNDAKEQVEISKHGRKK